MLWWCEISTGITPARALTITRFPAQKSACKDLGRNGQSVTSRAKDCLILRK
ncbi:Hypothetical protein LOCK900_0804 [Lacticaseibacillus rhamnosus LOCK900]|nr:Hypothetical protein LOCK900_0804 [Lacticaseibacillus rhamnosus LOCK900]